MSTVISAFGSSIIEFNIENSMFNMNYIMKENNGIKVYDEDRKIMKMEINIFLIMSICNYFAIG